MSQTLCDRNGWSVVAVIVEKDTSASTKRGAKRSDEWERVKALVEDGKAAPNSPVPDGSRPAMTRNWPKARPG
ncbi:hypothetical protein [Streptomyces zinciresistens]|uniref:hypothetical protein n=1 Tax=Streptomyces zinciresistens TaxID=1073330 RepID=UPI003CC58020